MTNNSELLVKLKILNNKLKIDSEFREKNYFLQKVDALYLENIDEIVYDDDLIEHYKQIRNSASEGMSKTELMKEKFKLLVLADAEIGDDLILLADQVYIEEHKATNDKQKVYKKTRKI